jgi:hypothetical protein
MAGRLHHVVQLGREFRGNAKTQTTCLAVFKCRHVDTLDVEASPETIL